MAKLTTQITITGVDFVCDVIQKFMDNADFKDSAPEEYQDGFYDFGNAIIKTLKEMRDKSPVADAAEVKHGEWKNNKNDYPECTNCGYMPMYDHSIDDIYYSPYCPNCGAKMRGTDNDL